MFEAANWASRQLTLEKTMLAELIADVIWGAEAIGEVIGKPTRATFHLLEAGLLPAKKIGKQWCASRRKLLHALTGEEPVSQ
jgi:hypothetical protein